MEAAYDPVPAARFAVSGLACMQAAEETSHGADRLQQPADFVTNSFVSRYCANVANKRATDGPTWPQMATRPKREMTMATTTSPIEVDFDAAAERVRGLNEKVLTAAKQTGTMSLDSYEQTVNSLLEFGQKAAEATQVDWVSALAKAQASYITEVTNAYTKAARDLLK
jgi:hypothetical protein